jgi:hypothetical protein
MNYSQLLSTVGQVHQAAQRTAIGAVNKLHVLRNWTFGYLIVEFEQHGEDRAAYGERVLKKLCADLAAGGMTGLGLSTLKGCRTFYRLYPQIGQSAIGEFNALLAGHPRSHVSAGPRNRIRRRVRGGKLEGGRGELSPNLFRGSGTFPPVRQTPERRDHE